MRGYLRQGTPPLLGAVELRRRRGQERVRFEQVADHLIDYARQHPEDGLAIDRLARFLAAVEAFAHDHDHPGLGSDLGREPGRGGAPGTRVPELRL
ncbi:MAG: DUF6104 family protein [Acidimicrobiales bacterium]